MIFAMINHFKKYFNNYFMFFGGYVLPLILNVIIFRIERPQNIDLQVIAVSTLAPLFNWVVPTTYGIDLILKTIGGWILL